MRLTENANTPSPSVAPLRRRRYPLDRAGRNSVRCGELLSRCDRMASQESSQMSVRIASESVSSDTSVGVGAL